MLSPEPVSGCLPLQSRAVDQPRRECHPRVTGDYEQDSSKYHSCSFPAMVTAKGRAGLWDTKSTTHPFVCLYVSPDVRRYATIIYDKNELCKEIAYHLVAPLSTLGDTIPRLQLAIECSGRLAREQESRDEIIRMRSLSSARLPEAEQVTRAEICRPVAVRRILEATDTSHQSETQTTVVRRLEESE